MRKRYLFIAATVLLLVLMVGLLPVFISSGWVKDQLVSQINSRISGTLTAAGCSIGWKRGLQCRRVVYDDAGRGIHVQIPKLSGSQGLLALIVAPMNQGTIRLDKPILVIPNPSLTASEPSAAASEPDASVAAQQPLSGSLPSSSESSPIWDKVIVQLLVDKGVVKIADGSSLGKKIARNVSLDAGLASGSVHFEMGFAAGSGGGKTAASGFINLPARQSGFLETLVTEINLKITDLQIEEYLSLLPTAFHSPQGQGILSSELLLKATGTSSIQVIGSNTLRNVQLTGGFIGEDKPAFKQVTLDVDVTRTQDTGWQFHGLHLFSDLGTLELVGNYGGAQLNLRGVGRLELTELLQQLPHLLRAAPETRLEHGGVDLVVNLEQDKQRLGVIAEATVDNVSGLQKGSPFFWDTPISFTFAGNLTGQSEPQVSRVALNSSFAQLEGAGGVNNFSLYATADLDQTMKQLGTVFQLDWQTKGKLLLTADSHQSGDNEYTLQTHLDISDMTLSHQGTVVLPEHHLTADSRLESSSQFLGNRNQPMNLSYNVHSWPGSLNGSFSSIYRSGQSIAAAWQLQSDLQLDKVTELLNNADLLARQTAVSGSLNLQGTGYLEADSLVVREVDAVIADFIFKDKETVFRDPAVRLVSRNFPAGSGVAGAVRELELADSPESFFNDGGGYSLIHPAARRIVVRDTQLSTSRATLDINRLVFADWQENAAGKRSFTLDLQADSLLLQGVDLQQLTMPVSLENDILQAELSGQLNKGTLQLSPRIDFSIAPPLLQLAEAEQVLTGVQLDQALDDGLLQRIHPLLGQLAHPVGTLNVRMDHCSWPLANPGAELADFSVVLDVSKLTFTADGILQKALQAAGLADSTLLLQQKEITCTGAEARISCTPLQLLAGDVQIGLTGSVGFDGSLDYLLALPITKQLVGTQAYPLLQGKTLEIPIRGNSEQLVFDTDVLTRAVSDLLGQAAGRDIETQVNNLLPGLLDGFRGNK